MSEIFEAQETQIVKNRGSNFVVIGLIVTFLAFSISVSSPWIMDSFGPEPLPVSEGDMAEVEEGGISKWLYSFIISEESQDNSAYDSKSEDLQADTDQELVTKHWTDNLAYIVLIIGIGGLLSSIIGLLQRQNKYIGWIGIFLGSAAIMLQYIFITLVVLAILVFFVFLLSAVGVEF